MVRSVAGSKHNRKDSTSPGRPDKKRPKGKNNGGNPDSGSEDEPNPKIKKEKLTEFGDLYYFTYSHENDEWPHQLRIAVVPQQDKAGNKQWRLFFRRERIYKHQDARDVPAGEDVYLWHELKDKKEAGQSQGTAVSAFYFGTLTKILINVHDPKRNKIADGVVDSYFPLGKNKNDDKYDNAADILSAEYLRKTFFPDAPVRALNATRQLWLLHFYDSFITTMKDAKDPADFASSFCVPGMFPDIPDECAEKASSGKKKSQASQDGDAQSPTKRDGKKKDAAALSSTRKKRDDVGDEEELPGPDHSNHLGSRSLPRAVPIATMKNSPVVGTITGGWIRRFKTQLNVPLTKQEYRKISKAMQETWKLAYPVPVSVLRSAREHAIALGGCLPVMLSRPMREFLSVTEISVSINPYIVEDPRLRTVSLWKLWIHDWDDDAIVAPVKGI
ncbi:hypothetical protein NA57DRAFT_53133 [Rhizodiscina lignyota]|uniref:Uncharacterized protein n=1 Tax=Rhizodiscina lignyota TaxID=1504668 RepID=A0A9P4MA74_9PEZI|nr:hypothetical protein NA57DRAFT_53133 [Rhizodiscina lignyota]